MFAHGMRNSAATSEPVPLPTRFRRTSPIQIQQLRYSLPVRLARCPVRPARTVLTHHLHFLRWWYWWWWWWCLILFPPPTYRFLLSPKDRNPVVREEGGIEKNPSVLTWAFGEPAWGGRTRLKLQTCNPAERVQAASCSKVPLFMETLRFKVASQEMGRILKEKESPDISG